MTHEYCNKLFSGRTLNQFFIHYKGIPRFCIYSLPLSIKITEACTHTGNPKSVDLEIKCTGILYEEENCQVFSERLLLLSTASGYTNFTLI
jgi:hypothetical protein